MAQPGDRHEAHALQPGARQRRRHQRHAHAQRHQRHHGQPLARRVARARVDAGALQQRNHVVVVGRRRIAREHDEALMPQLAQRHGLRVRQRMLLRQAAHQVVFGQRQVRQARRHGGHVDEAGVQLALRQRQQLLAGRQLAQLHLDARRARGKGVDDARHVAIRHGAGKADVQPPGQAGGHGARGLGGTLHVVEHGAHFDQVGMAGRGQGDVLATMAYIEDELGLKCNLDKNAIRDANFVCKQIMPYYDRYCAPYFQGIDYDVTRHGMPGGATSSSQEGAMKQGYIHLLPYMLKFLEGTRQIVRYHDVTPGSQITWYTAFLAVTGAWKRGGEDEVRYLLEVLGQVTRTPEKELTDEMRRARLNIYQDCNDAFRNLLQGKFGKLPLGFPADWVYQSAFGSDWKSAMAARTETSPLESLPEVNLAAEEKACTEILKRKPNDEEFVLYLNHPADALKTIQFKAKFGDPNNLPLHVWFEGLKVGQDLYFNDSSGKPHHLLLLSISTPNDAGISICRYVLDSEFMSCEVQVRQPSGNGAKSTLMADTANKYHVAAPSNGDLWVMYVHPGDVVKAGEELFNVSIMKQEKAVLAPIDGMVKRVLKTADFKENKQMVSVREGELIVELGPVPRVCGNEACGQPIPMDNIAFCPYCGVRVS